MQVEVGTKVRSVHVRTWGEGVVTEVITDKKLELKPLVVVRDDGRVGYFHYDQVEEV